MAPSDYKIYVVTIKDKFNARVITELVASCAFDAEQNALDFISSMETQLDKKSMKIASGTRIKQLAA